MKAYFYRLAPIILAVVGLIFSICGYFIENHTSTDVHLRLWAGFIFVQVAAGATLGMFIKKLYDHTNSDPLTGLRNRRCFYQNLAWEMQRLKRTKLPLSLAMIDVDNFKNINDTYGHIEGDQVLIKLANILKAHTRAIDTVARWGGEEFTVILPGTGIEGAKLFAERIRKVVEKSDSCHKITVCVGVASTTHKMEMDRLVALTDQALYKAKERKNRVVIMESSKYAKPLL
ncbi:MAG: GGDEF domain-containing protein [Dehalobacterium sp.]